MTKPLNWRFRRENEMRQAKDAQRRAVCTPVFPEREPGSGICKRRPSKARIHHLSFSVSRLFSLPPVAYPNETARTMENISSRIVGLPCQERAIQTEGVHV